MKALDTFHPFIDTPETANPDAGCSAHYFEIEGPMLGAAWYGQGLRLIDISDARHVRQVGYYRVTGTDTDNPSSNSWDMAFRSDRKRGDLVYLFDMSRGVEILRMKKGVNASRRMKAVTAPSVKRDPLAAKPVGALGRTWATPASATSARCSPRPPGPSGRRASGAPSGCPALGAQLVQVRLERPPRRELQPVGHAVPGGVDQRVLAADARVERGHDPALALEPVRDVLVELGAGVGDLGAVPGVEPLQPEPAQPPQAVEVRPRARRRPASSRTLPTPSTASPVNASAPVTNTRWSAAWPGTCRTVKGPNASPSASGGSRPTGTSPSRARSGSTASAWSGWSCVSAIPPAPPRSATAAASASRCSSSAGPGSTTHAGSRPTT